jgi:hypothetical protein
MTLAGSCVSTAKVDSRSASPQQEQPRENGDPAADDSFVAVEGSAIVAAVVTPTTGSSANPADEAQETSPGAGGRSEGEIVLDDEEDEARRVARCNRLSATITYALESIMSFRFTTSEHPLGEPNKLFSFSVASRASNYNFRMEARTTHFGVWCISPLRIPEGQRVRVAEFIARVNYTILLGLFDTDMSDGEIRFKILQRNVDGVCDSPRLIATLLTISFQAMDKYFPGIMQVTYAGVSPERAVRECESRSRDDDDDDDGEGGGSESRRDGVAVDQ